MSAAGPAGCTGVVDVPGVLEESFLGVFFHARRGREGGGITFDVIRGSGTPPLVILRGNGGQRTS